MANPSVPNVAANNQGSIKLSEVSVDNAEEVIDTVALQDGLTAFEQLRRVATDSLRKSAMILISTQPVTWVGPSSEIIVPVGVSIILKLLLNPASTSARTINLMFTGLPTTWIIPNGGVIYIELERSIVDSSGGTVVLTDGINGAGTPGQRIILLDQTTMPILESNESLTNQSTISIPLVLRQDDTTNGVQNIWWIPHGILWSGSVSSYLGEIQTSTTIPLGGIIAYSSPSGGTNSVLTQAGLSAVAPGFWLCDGSSISNASSPFFGSSTPNLNGGPNNVNSVTVQGVTTGGSATMQVLTGLQYLALGAQIFASGGYFPAGTYIAAISSDGSNNITLSNPRLAGSPVTSNWQFTQNVFIRGSQTSPNNGSAYSGENNHKLVTNENATHTHVVSDPGHAHNFTYRFSAGAGGGATLPIGEVSSSESDEPVGSGSVLTGSTGLTNQTSGLSVPHNNQPAFFNALYIMRII